MHDILLVSGTRPEIIKLAPVYHELRRRDWARVSWLHTGQHGEMAGPILASFGIRPDYAFERHGSTLDEFSAQCREQLAGVMRERAWSSVIVQGDTESTFLGALAGFYHRVPVSHVEAGLRTHNLDRPFPEEGLRQMISRIARHQFAPTARARDMLLREAVPESHVEVTGNTVVDAQKWLIEQRGLQRRRSGRGHILVTVHRRENWGDDVAQICHAVADIAMCYPQSDILFPVHLNPVIQGPARDILGGLPNVRLTAPLDYLEMQQALIDSWLVLSDSGGLQEEAPTFGVPLLVLREETERPEAVEAGCARIVGTDRERIFAQVCDLWDNDTAYAAMHRVANPFGDGRASERIADRLARSFGLVHDEREAAA
ncbi:non-hydrolyzing UDP-N-acetylglucosamine 2-epimerase [Lysobacter xanthus]